eukprot:3044387-Pyramimonas_sp.AAC.1
MRARAVLPSSIPSPGRCLSCAAHRAPLSTVVLRVAASEACRQRCSCHWLPMLPGVQLTAA